MSKHHYVAASDFEKLYKCAETVGDVNTIDKCVFNQLKAKAFDIILDKNVDVEELTWCVMNDRNLSMNMLEHYNFNRPTKEEHLTEQEYELLYFRIKDNYFERKNRI